MDDPYEPPLQTTSDIEPSQATTKHNRGSQALLLGVPIVVALLCSGVFLFVNLRVPNGYVRTQATITNMSSCGHHCDLYDLSFEDKNSRSTHVNYQDVNDTISGSVTDRVTI